jgi:hypothetical protein
VFGCQRRWLMRHAVVGLAGVRPAKGRGDATMGSADRDGACMPSAALAPPCPTAADTFHLAAHAPERLLQHREGPQHSVCCIRCACQRRSGAASRSAALPTKGSVVRDAANGRTNRNSANVGIRFEASHAPCSPFQACRASVLSSLKARATAECGEPRSHATTSRSGAILRI